MNTSGLLLVAAGLLPLAWIALLYVRRGGALALTLAPFTALPALVLAVGAAPDLVIELHGVLLGLRLGLDATAQAFLWFSAPLWLLAGLYANAYLARDPRRRRFVAFFLATMGGSLGLIVAQDIVGFYLCFALMTFAAYGLIVHTGSTEARRAGRVYLVMAVLGEALLFVGLLLAADAAGGLALVGVPAAVAASPARDAIIALVFAGFGIKVGVPLLHLWLPLAHPVAPTPASAVLSGVILKAGLLGWLRFLPLGAAAAPDWGALLTTAGLTAMFFGVAIGLAQTNAKVVLAYSSISQMGFMTVCVGIGLAQPAAWPLALTATLAYACHHAFAKSALFLGVGVIAAAAHGRRRWILAGLLLPALALAGAPLTSGALAKLYIKDVALLAPSPWPATIETLLPLAALGTALLMARFLWLLARMPRAAALAPKAMPLTGVWLVMLAAVALATWLLPLPVPDNAALLARWQSAWWSAAWPLLTAAGAAAITIRLRLRIPAALRLPPGDLVVPVERTLRACAGFASALASMLRGIRIPARRVPAEPMGSAEFAVQLARWPVAGLLWLVLTLLLLLLLLATGR